MIGQKRERERERERYIKKLMEVCLSYEGNFYHMTNTILVISVTTLE